MTKCECGNTKARVARACDRCRSIERELWRWLPMATKRKTEAERNLAAFERRFAGVADWHNKSVGTGRKHGPGIEVKRKGGPRPPEFELPLPNDLPMSIAQSAYGQYPRELRARERRELVAQDAA